MSAITFERGTGPLQFSISGGEWWVTHPHKTVTYTEEQRYVAMFKGIELPEDGGVLAVQINEAQLFNTLTPNELRLMLGYCSHVKEHGSTHIGSLMAALYEAHTSAKWAVFRTTLNELDECLSSIELAGSTARAIFDYRDGVDLP